MAVLHQMLDTWSSTIHSNSSSHNLKSISTCQCPGLKWSISSYGSCFKHGTSLFNWGSGSRSLWNRVFNLFNSLHKKSDRTSFFLTRTIQVFSTLLQHHSFNAEVFWGKGKGMTLYLYTWWGVAYGYFMKHCTSFCPVSSLWAVKTAPQCHNNASIFLCCSALSSSLLSMYPECSSTSAAAWICNSRGQISFCIYPLGHTWNTVIRGGLQGKELMLWIHYYILPFFFGPIQGSHPSLIPWTIIELWDRFETN